MRISVSDASRRRSRRTARSPDGRAFGDWCSFESGGPLSSRHSGGMSECQRSASRTLGCFPQTDPLSDLQGVAALNYRCEDDLFVPLASRSNFSGMHQKGRL
jgi:hypothetical protein